MVNFIKKVIKDKRGEGEGWLVLACIIVAIILIGVATWGGCYLFGSPSYETVTRFTYSIDGGQTYKEGLQEIAVGDSYYMCIEMQVIASKDKNNKDTVAKVVIPKTEIVDCYLDDYPGTKIQGKEDTINGVTTYEFKVPSSTAPLKYRVIFECTASQQGRQTMEVIYDDNVSPTWDKTETIKYI